MFLASLGDGLLEDPAGVLVLLELASQALDLLLEFADAGVAAIQLDALASGGIGRLFHLLLEFVNGERVVGAQPVLVGSDLGRG